MIVWGNHSNTQFPDVDHCIVVVMGKPMFVRDAVKDDHWINNVFVKIVQNRGAEVGLSEVS